MEKKNKYLLGPQKVKHTKSDLHDKVIQELIAKFEKCLQRYRKHLHLRTVLRLGKYIKGNTFHLKILQLGKVRQFKHMVSFYLNKNDSQTKSEHCEQMNETSTSIASRLDTLRNRRKTLEEKDKQLKWDAERRLEDQARLVPCTSRAAAAKDKKLKEANNASAIAASLSIPKSLPRSKSFFDKLLLKINRSNSSSAEDIIKETNKDDETSSCSSNAGFLGFHEADQETFKRTTSCESLSDNLENKSAFVSEKLEEFLKENALENCSSITIPTIKFRYEEGMVHSGSEMPTMDIPKQLLKRKARTVAEKRQILESKKDVKYLMVENESTIYWELQRRLKKSKTFSYDLISTIQNQDIPIRRGVWKTAAWLATRSGKFYFQSIEIENDIKNYRINLYGGQGNYDSKLIHLRKPEFKRYNSSIKCTSSCNNLKMYPNLKIDVDEILEISKYSQETEPHKIINRLNLISKQRQFKPGPLSSKVKHDGTGELQIFEMPKIQLELNPRPGFEFDINIKKYLNIIMPSDNITEEWAKFAVSTLIEPPAIKKGAKSNQKFKQQTYTFDVPYLDNQNKVLARKDRVKRIYTPAIYTSGIDTELNKLDTPLKILPKHIDQNDTVQCEIGDYLNDMFNSAVIGLCQNSIIKNDPDLNYNRKDGVQSQLKGKRINNFHDKKVRKNKSKLLNELRRLNATFIETSDAGDNHECNEEHCTLGCVCTDIRKIPPLHCRKEKCMFACTCKKLEERAYIKQNAVVEDGLSEEDMKLLRDRATCRLAKMEKDFSSTIVLTNDNTILIHNTQVESKRNRKPSRILKGYSTDDFDKDEEKTIAKVTPIPVPEKEMNATNLNKYKSIEYMTHCNVVLDQVPELDGLEIWCMVHCLYKCFCNGTATKGDVFGFTDISAKTTQHFPPAPAKRRNYTFEKIDSIQGPAATFLKPATSMVPAKASSSGLSIRSSSNGPRASKIINKTIIEPEEPRLSRLEVVNYEYYRIKNKASRRKILKYLNAEGKLQSILKQRVNECLYSKRLNQFKKTSNVVIVLSESEDENENVVQKIPTIEKKQEFNDTSYEESNNNQAINDNEETVISEEETVDVIIQPDTGSSEENDRPVTPESNPTNLIVPESPGSYNPFNHRVPVDKFIQFSQQIENGLIKYPSKTNAPIKSENVTKLNLIVTKAMSKLCEMQKNNLNDVPDPKLKGFNNISWDNLIKIYNNNRIYIWEVRRMTKSSNLNLLLAITKTCNMPKIENAVSVVCIKAVRPDDLSVTGKMINLQIMNEKTKKLAVIIYGQVDHWIILGCIHSDINYLEDGVCVRPTPATHPLLATKINQLNTLLCTNPFILQNRNTKTTPIMPLKPLEKTVSSTEISNTSNIHKTNIEVVSFSLNDNTSIFLPIPVIGDHRWFMLTIEPDFSDIYIPTWHSFLKYERIVATHKIARSRSKTVRILHMNNEHTVPHVFITPKESNKIFFGPYRVDQDVSMVLCQECDGKMLSREVYEENTSVTKGNRTTGCWLYVKNNELVPGKTNISPMKVVKNGNSDDVTFLDEVDTTNNKDDCILIEDDDDVQIDPLQIDSPSPTIVDGGNIKSNTSPSNVAVDVDDKTLVKSASDEKQTCSETNSILPIDDAHKPSLVTAPTKDMAKFSLIPGTKRSKGLSILKPISIKPNGSAVGIEFSELKPGQIAASTVSKLNQRCVSPPISHKQMSILKNHMNGKFLKLKPFAQETISPKQKSLSPPRLTEPTSTPTDEKEKSVEKVKVETNKLMETIVTIDNDNVVTKPLQAAARLINRRKTIDANTVLNRMVYNSEPNYSMLGKRKSNEFLEPMKKPLLTSNLAVFKKQHVGVAPQEQIKILLKRKKTCQTDDQKFTKLRIIEDPIAISEKSASVEQSTETNKDAVTKALKKLSSTSTYIRKNVTSTVTSATLADTPSSSPVSLPTISPASTSSSSINLHSTIKNYQRVSIDSTLTSNNKLLHLTDLVKPKEKIVPASSGEIDPRLNIKAYIVPDCPNLGKIPCMINKLNITFQLPIMENSITLSGLSSLNLFLQKKIGEYVHSIIPNDLDLKWSITSDRKKTREIRDLDSAMLNKNKVLTQFGLIDLRENFENDALLITNPVLMVKLLILQLDRILNEQVNGGLTKRNSAFQILQKTQAYVKQLKADEAQLMKTKLSLYKEIYHKKNELSKLTDNEIIISDSKVNTSPTVPTTPKRLFLHYGRSDSNAIANNTDKNNFNLKPIVKINLASSPVKTDVIASPETIVIDDDD